MEEINNFQQEPDETLYQAWERFKELLMKCPQHYLTEMQEVILFYNGLDILTRQILDSRGFVPTKTVADAKKAIQKMAEYSQKLHNETSRGKRASISVMPLATYLNLGLGKLAHTRLTVELADRTVKYPKGIAENVTKPFLSIARAKIDVYKRKITLRVGEEMIVFSSVKPTSSLIKRVYMLSLRERMELDLEARLMGETLVLNRSLDPFLEDYIELNEFYIEHLELRRKSRRGLMPTCLGR
ncbi:putative reverse transcriptase domain-containing protein [Tanacetum coccineum]|uniref:Reverse transcriptase domain-containing protein n=1 Tax=Tanacetum coccineum TaxID=301880 RepID=A0ABQ5A6H6_9ASTR